MQFTLPRPEFSEKLTDVILKVMEKKEEVLSRLSPSKIKELKKVCQMIEEMGMPEHLVVRQLPEPLGYGIFLHPKARPLARGTLIGSYAGEVYLIAKNLPDQSAYAFVPYEDIMLTKKEHSDLHLKDPFNAKKKYLLHIDAENKGNFTRYINHSENPNVEARLMRVGKNKLGVKESPLEVIYFVKRKINPGQQLLVCYEDEEKSYWGALGIKPDPIVADTFSLDAKLNLIKKSS